jgi:hypothetical protein
MVFEEAVAVGPRMILMPVIQVQGRVMEREG